MPDFTVIATWPFGQTAVKAAAVLLAAGQSALDAAVAGAQAVEDDPAVHSVGFGGLVTSSERCSWTPASWKERRSLAAAWPGWKTCAMPLPLPGA